MMTVEPRLSLHFREDEAVLDDREKDQSQQGQRQGELNHTLAGRAPSLMSLREILSTHSTPNRQHISLRYPP